MPILLALILGFTLSSYKKELKGTLESFSVFSQHPRVGYELKNKDTDAKLNYEPNVHSFTGVSVSTDLIGLSLAYQEVDEDKEHIEPSNLFDIQIFGKYKNHMWEVFYQNYQGLFISENKVLENNLESANSWTYGFGVKKFLRSSYKMSDSFGDFAKKKKSNWTPVMGVFINKSRLSREEGLIPGEFSTDFDQLYGLTALETTSLGLEFGLTGLYEFNGFFIGGLFSVGQQIQQQNFSGIDEEDRTVNPFNLFIYADAGYEWGEGHSVGFMTRAYSSNIPVKNSEYNLSRALIGFYYKYFF